MEKMTTHEICDDLLRLCLEKNGITKDGSLQRRYTQNGNTINELEGALHFLSNNPPAFLDKSMDYYALTPTGEFFITNGGYAGQRAHEEKESLEKQRDKELQNNVQKSILETNGIQRKTMIITLIVAACSVIISLFNLLQNNDRSKLQRQVELLSRQQLSTLQVLDTIRCQVKMLSGHDGCQRKAVLKNQP